MQINCSNMVLPYAVYIRRMCFCPRTNIIQHPSVLGFVYSNWIFCTSRCNVARLSAPVNAIYCKYMCISYTALSLPKKKFVHIWCRPKHEGVIIRARNELRAFSVEGTRPDGRRVTLESIRTKPISCIFSPDFNRIIVACREKEIEVRVPANELYVLAMSLHDAETFKFYSLHSLPDPHLLVSPTSREICSTSTPGDTFHFAFMSLQACN
jgi:hypothetical protein